MREGGFPALSFRQPSLKLVVMQESNLPPWDFTRQFLRTTVVFKPLASGIPIHHRCV